MDKCALCKGGLTEYSEVSEGVAIKGWKCQKCNESFFPASQMLRWEVLTGRRKSLVRQVRTVGNSKVVTLPEQITSQLKIHDADLILFKKIKDKDSILVKVIRPESR